GDGLDAEGSQQRRGAGDRGNPLGIAPRLGHREVMAPVAAQAFEGMAAVLPIVVVRGSDEIVVDVLLGRFLGEGDQSGGVAIRQRLQEYRRDHAEDRGVGADPKSQRRDRDGIETRPRTPGTKSVTQVLPDAIELHRSYTPGTPKGYGALYCRVSGERGTN